MSARIAYFRVSTKDQDVAAQRATLGGTFDKEFQDEGVSGSVLAADRPGFAALLKFVRDGDTVFVSAVDRLGRDAIDVQTTVRFFLDRGVSVDVKGLGVIVLAQVAQMERARILERCESGRDVARASLAATGKTHKGKTSLGRPLAGDAVAVMAWKTANSASIFKTAEQFKISTATVKRYASAS